MRKEPYPETDKLLVFPERHRRMAIADQCAPIVDQKPHIRFGKGSGRNTMVIVGEVVRSCNDVRMFCRKLPD